ncbi:MAG: HAD-IA family hydrolase [bacterium]|nr:HAD-IA family hydrolase [bacterium]
MKYEAVLFDLDGTLLDYKEAQRKATNYSRQFFDLVNSPEIQSFESRGIPLPNSQNIQKAFQRAGVQANPEVFLNNYFSSLSQQGILIKGAKEIVLSLYDNVKLAVVSNGSGDVQIPRMKKAGIARFFHHKFFSRDVGAAKPDPAILNLAMNTLNVSAGKTLFIGDSTTSDQPAALSAKIDFFLFKGSFKDPELLELLR